MMCFQKFIFISEKASTIIEDVLYPVFLENHGLFVIANRNDRQNKGNKYN
jgi:hypothetical protein